MIYRALTGAPPFAGPTAPQLLYAIVHEHPLRPSELVPELPRDIDRFLAIALAKSAGDRFASIDELSSALREASQQSLAEETRIRADRLAAWRTA